MKTGQEYSSNLITSWINRLVFRRGFIITEPLNSMGELTVIIVNKNRDRFEIIRH